ncbi:MAG: hypothetical protein EOP10_14505, partial [Proteobacteria bacterium]
MAQRNQDFGLNGTFPCKAKIIFHLLDVKAAREIPARRGIVHHAWPTINVKVPSAAPAAPLAAIAFLLRRLSAIEFGKTKDLSSLAEECMDQLDYITLS